MLILYRSDYEIDNYSSQKLDEENGVNIYANGTTEILIEIELYFAHIALYNSLPGEQYRFLYIDDNQQILNIFIHSNFNLVMIHIMILDLIIKYHMVIIMNILIYHQNL